MWANDEVIALPEWMTDAVKLAHADGRQIQCAVSYTDRAPYRMRLEGPGITDEVQAPSLFECLMELRREHENAGWRFLCAGARVDAWPSGMSLDWSGGTRLTLLTRGPVKSV